MEYNNQYYDGLDHLKLAHDDLWLIVCIEAVYYFKSCHQKGIRFSRLRERCDTILNQITNGKRTNFGGSFPSIIYSHRYEMFWHVDKAGNKETWVYPNILAIEDEVRYRKLENSNRRLFRVVPPNAIVQFKQSIDEPPISVSEHLQVKVIRATDSKSKSN
jgi:hypothetical protein